MDEATITCSSCGREVDEALTWCPYCGNEIRAAEPAESAGIASSDPADGGTPGETSPAPAPGFSTATIVTLAVLAAAVAGAALLWFLVLRDGDRGDLSVLDAGPGDCWNSATVASDQLVSLPQVPCDEPHDFEVFAIAELAGGPTAPYPGEEPAFLDGLAVCVEAFEGYVGVPFAESPLDLDVLYPTEASWAEGDREAICSLFPADASVSEGSQRGSDLRLPEAADGFEDAASCSDIADATLGIAQQSIDTLDSYTEEEFDDMIAGGELPPQMLVLAKEETLLMARAAEAGCSLDTVNEMVMARAGGLQAGTSQGQSLADDIAATGYFLTG
jgi:hypothetical protein